MNKIYVFRNQFWTSWICGFLSLRVPLPSSFLFIDLFIFYLFLGLEDVAAEDVALSISSDVTENLQILGVMRHVEYPERRNKMGQQNRT